MRVTCTSLRSFDEIILSYFTSYLQVVYHLSISTAGYISSIYDVVAAVWMFPVGYLIRRSGKYKWLLYIGEHIHL